MTTKYKINFLIAIHILVLAIGCEMETSNTSPNSNIIRDKDGKVIEGELTKYYKNGKLAAVMNFKNSKLDGQAVKYYEDGITKRSDLKYSTGLLEGVQKRYYKSGSIYKEELYNKGKRDGLTRKYREDGKLMSEAVFKNGFAGTDLKEYLTDGRLKKIYPKIVINTEDRLSVNGTFKIIISLSDKSKKVEYYLGKLEEGIYLSDSLSRQYNVNEGVLICPR